LYLAQEGKDGCMTTQCIDPSAIKEGTLLAYIDGQENEQVRRHLERCSYCAAQAESLRRMTATLKATLYRHSCPPPEQLALYQLRLLPASAQLAMAKHVRECPHCTTELAELARVEHKAPLLERLRRTADVIQAVLVPSPRPSTAPLRGVSSIPQRFRAADESLVSPLDILVSVLPGHSRRHKTVMGRLLCGEDLLPNAASEVCLIRNGDPRASPLEVGGTFVFHDVEPGEYDIGLEWQGRIVLLKQVVVE
jgi:hypothetical protein